MTKDMALADRLENCIGDYHCDDKVIREAVAALRRASSPAVVTVEDVVCPRCGGTGYQNGVRGACSTCDGEGHVEFNVTPPDAAAAPAVGERWQDISTAPKDGTVVDVWCRPPKGSLAANPSGDRVSDCWYSQDKWWRYDDSKYATDIANCRTEIWNVTYWQPLPSPPAQGTQTGTGE